MGKIWLNVGKYSSPIDPMGYIVLFMSSLSCEKQKTWQDIPLWERNQANRYRYMKFKKNNSSGLVRLSSRYPVVVFWMCGLVIFCTFVSIGERRISEASTVVPSWKWIQKLKALRLRKMPVRPCPWPDMSLTQTACLQKRPKRNACGFPRNSKNRCRGQKTNHLDFGEANVFDSAQVTCVWTNIKCHGFTISATNKDCKTTHGHTSQSNSPAGSSDSIFLHLAYIWVLIHIYCDTLAS